MRIQVTCGEWINKNRVRSVEFKANETKDHRIFKDEGTLLFTFWWSVHATVYLVEEFNVLLQCLILLSFHFLQNSTSALSSRSPFCLTLSRIGKQTNRDHILNLVHIIKKYLPCLYSNPYLAWCYRRNIYGSWINNLYWIMKVCSLAIRVCFGRVSMFFLVSQLQLVLLCRGDHEAVCPFILLLLPSNSQELFFYQFSFSTSSSSPVKVVTRILTETAILINNLLIPFTIESITTVELKRMLNSVKTNFDALFQIP